MRDLAGDTTLGTMTPVQLYAGEAPIVTDRYTTAPGISLAKYEVFALNAGGQAVKFDPAGTAPFNIAIGIAAQPAGPSASFPSFDSGAFNHEALVWPAVLTDLITRKSVFARTTIKIMKLL